MNLEQLMSEGAIIPDAPVKRSITWKRGKSAGGNLEFDVYVKILSSTEMREIFSDKTDIDASLISSAIVLADNQSERFSLDQAAKLKPSLKRALARAVIEENDLGEDSPKN